MAYEDWELELGSAMAQYENIEALYNETIMLSDMISMTTIFNNEEIVGGFVLFFEEEEDEWKLVNNDYARDASDLLFACVATFDKALAMDGYVGKGDFIEDGMDGIL